MRTGLFDIEALSREPTRHRDGATSWTRHRAYRRRARDLGVAGVDKRGREPEEHPRGAPPRSR